MWDDNYFDVAIKKRMPGRRVTDSGLKIDPGSIKISYRTLNTDDVLNVIETELLRKGLDVIGVRIRKQKTRRNRA